MNEPKPDYISQGETARLFPVLATTSKEGRATSILLACISRIDEFGKSLLASVGRRVGKRAVVEAYTEVCFKGDRNPTGDRPDGLIIVRTGVNEWRALVEAKVGSNDLNEDQIERYRAIAREHDIDCVITISNQFATSPENHPLASVRKSRSRIPVYHWSWMFILTTADLLINNSDVEDSDQALLLNELRRFLSHESTGVRGFERMPSEWTELNRLVSAGGKIPLRSEDAAVVLGAWHQETKDLSLILSRQTETVVTQRLSRKHAVDPAQRHRDELGLLCETNQLVATLDVPDAAAPLNITADLARRTIEVGMTLRAPEDKISAKARVNWLLRQIKTENDGEIFVRLHWPGKSAATLYSLSALREDSAIADTGKEGQRLLSFDILLARRTGGRFTQQTNFITDLETAVPEFYREVGQGLTSWRPSAPRIKEDKSTAEAVNVESIGDDAAEDSLST